MIKVSQFRSQFDFETVTFIDYDFTATKHAKKKAKKELEELGALEYIKEKRPEVYEDLIKI